MSNYKMGWVAHWEYEQAHPSIRVSEISRLLINLRKNYLNKKSGMYVHIDDSKTFVRLLN